MIKMSAAWLASPQYEQYELTAQGKKLETKVSFFALVPPHNSSQQRAPAWKLRSKKLVCHRTFRGFSLNLSVPE